MKGTFVISVEPAEVVRLLRILQDGDEREALDFLREHCKEDLRRYFYGS